MDTLGAARLAKEIPANRAVATIVRRDEITAVLQDPDSEPELYLRITGDALDEGDRSEIAMTWSREDLQQLLEGAGGEDVVLTFDRDELAQALFADVEAHGMRQRAAVFAVVAAGALGTGAGIATAMPSGDDGGPVVTQVAPAAPVGSMVTDASSAAGYATAPDGAASVVSNVAEAQAKAASGLARTASAIGSTAASATGSTVTDASSAAGYAAPSAADTASSSTVSDAASGSGYAAPADASAGSTRTDVSSGGGYGPAQATESTGGGILSIHEPSTTDGLLVGGVLLAIAGATFASRRHSGTSRPA